LYTTNKTKVADVIYGCEYDPPKDYEDLLSRWIQIRFPSAYIRQNNNVPDEERYVVKPLSQKSHYPLLRKEAAATMLEW
jgi:hypothetical protein